MPAHLVAEIVLPDVEHAPDDAEHVRGVEFAGSLGEPVEMAACVGAGRRAHRPLVGRQIRVAVELRLADRVNHVHARIAGARADATRPRCDVDRFGIDERRKGRRLRKQPEPGTELPEPAVQLARHVSRRPPHTNRTLLIWRRPASGIHLGWPCGDTAPSPLPPNRARQLRGVREPQRASVGIDIAGRRQLGQQCVPGDQLVDGRALRARARLAPPGRPASRSRGARNSA